MASNNDFQMITSILSTILYCWIRRKSYVCTRNNKTKFNKTHKWMYEYKIKILIVLHNRIDKVINRKLLTRNDT